MSRDINRRLADEIAKMAVADQKMRQKFLETGDWDTKIDRKNTKRLKEIINAYGWPTVGLVGKRNSERAWLLAQHADHDISFQKKCLRLMKKAYEENPGNVPKRNIAYLMDRILVHEGKEQLFGTQFYKNDEGVLIPNPIKDPENLDKRRRDFGLGAFRKLPLSQ